MLGLKLRDEFKGRRLKGTAIELSNNNNTGATQRAASDFLEITYPTHDVLKLLEAAGPNKGRPIVLKGERGQGKSHLMAVLYHAHSDHTATTQWLNDWAHRLNDPQIASIQLQSGMHVISESMQRQRYKHLWDVLFENHPHGVAGRAKWEVHGTAVPSDEIVLEMLEHTPTTLILDEYQTWFDGLTSTKQHPWKNWAFNFIQILSEIAQNHPDKLVLVVSVRNGNSDAFQQIQRVNPSIVDFAGPSAKHDRARLLLHRLFENRLQVAGNSIESLIDHHITEYLRLKNSPPAEHQRIRDDFIEMWPYAPHLMQLLEDQVLVASAAQGTRDLIRILADLFKRRGEQVSILTAADFRLDDEDCGVIALLDSVANQHLARLREKALRNLDAVKAAVPDTSRHLKHLEGIIGSLWVRSLANVNQAGADQATLQIDVTQSAKVDDNAFQVELTNIVENSFNIHEDGNRYIFKEEENPQAKLIASARNDRLFQENQDSEKLAKEVRYVIGGGQDVATKFKVIVMPQYWKTDPWSKLDDEENPSRWDDRIPLLILPESPSNPDATLGKWLRDNLQSNRNAARFLLPQDGSTNIFSDRDLLVLARCVYLAEQWRTQNPEYGRLHNKYQKELREILKARFDRFSIIANWNFQQPENCRFATERHNAQGSAIPEAVDQHISENLFIPEEFEAFIIEAAPNTESVGKLLRELKEPRPGGTDCIPWLGEVASKEKIIRLCAKGLIAIDLRGMEYLQVNAGETEDAAWRRMRGKLGSGSHLDQTHVLLPQNAPAVGGGGNPPTSVTLTGGGGTDTTIGGGSRGAGGGATTDPPIGGGTGNATTPGGLFGGGPTRRIPINIPTTSALNLLGRIETQQINTGTQLHNCNLKVDRLTGAQLQELIKKLPDGMTYQLDMEKEEAE